MPHCHVCGRELTKSPGPIGPKCLQKLKGKSRVARFSRAQYIKMAAKHDMYGELNGQKENDATSKNSAGEKISQNGSSC